MNGSDGLGDSEDRRVIDLSLDGAGGEPRPEGPSGEENLIDWPVRVGDPPRRAEAFQERPGPQAVIDEALSRGVVAVVATSSSAPGGTQLALGSFETACRSGTDLTLWVPAGSRESVLSTYALARTATTPGATAAPGRTVERARAFLAWLTSTDRTWLVVLDGVVEPDHLRNLWPSGPHGKVIVTTRRPEVAARGQDHVIVRTGPFEPAESLSYLSTRLGTVGGLPVGVLDGACELAEDLGRLPSALAQAATVVARGRTTCSGYRQLLAQRARSHDTWMPGADVRAVPGGPGAGLSGGRPRSEPDVDRRLLAASCLLAMERATEQDPAGPLPRLLRLIAVLDPAGIPENLLTCVPIRVGLLPGPGPRAGRWSTLKHQLRTAARIGAHEVSPAAVRQALWQLHRFHLVDHDPDVGVVRCGALTRQVVLGLLETPERAVLVRLAADALDTTWPDNETDPVLGRMLRSNASTLISADPQTLWLPRPHPVLALLGRSLAEVGLAGEAADHLRRLAEVAAELMGPDHPDVVRIRQEIGEGSAPGAGRS
ncbi:MAG: hypothetical protein QG608_974 [Actinomycetota bacterium]|nr:hypothetical protein [Actinomycetota bacterium]